jgi:hypothetical protein
MIVPPESDRDGKSGGANHGRFDAVMGSSRLPAAPAGSGYRAGKVDICQSVE